MAFVGLSLKILADCFQTGNTLGGILHFAAGLVCLFSANVNVNRAIALADAQRAAAASASAGGTVNAGGTATASPYDLQPTHSQTLSNRKMNTLIDDIEVPVERVELLYAGYSTIDDLLWFD